MKLYKIRNWNTLYENNRTRELKKLDWLPIPNKQDGDGYTAIMEQKDGLSIFGAFICCAQIASRCEPRGTLVRDNQKPHDAHSLARMSRLGAGFPHDGAGIVQRMLDFCSGEEVNWLEVNDLQEFPHDGAGFPHDGAPRARAQKGREGKGREWKRREENKGADAPIQIPASLNSPEFLKVWAQRIQHLREKRKGTPTAIKAQLKKCEEWGQPRAIAALEASMQNDWQGLFEPNGKSVSQTKKPDHSKGF